MAATKKLRIEIVSEDPSDEEVPVVALAYVRTGAEWHTEMRGADGQWRRLEIDTDGRSVLWEVAVLSTWDARDA